MFRIADGKLAEQWISLATLDLLQQLGAFSQPVPAAAHPGSPSESQSEHNGAVSGRAQKR
jgi:hypothetical protein